MNKIVIARPTPAIITALIMVITLTYPFELFNFKTRFFMKDTSLKYNQNEWVNRRGFLCCTGYSKGLKQGSEYEGDYV